MCVQWQELQNKLNLVLGPLYVVPLDFLLAKNRHLKVSKTRVSDCVSLAIAFDETKLK